MINSKAQLLFAVLLFQTSLAFSQQNSSAAESRFSIHLTTTSLFDRGDESFTYTSGDESFEILNTVSFDSGFDPGLSFSRISPKGSFYRIGLIGLNIAESRQTETIRTTDLATEIIYGTNQSLSQITTQFELGKYFKRGKISLGTGVFIRPSYLYFRSLPKAPLDFAVRIHDASIDLGINPIVELALTDQLTITAQLPTTLGRTQLSSVHYDNPFVIENERTVHDFDAEIDVNLGLQVGLMVGF